ncbi:MAG: hypothetical protein IPK16_02410 [Anaerolineales bacterium]|nr:hypothetical protein [Anaerolineales bacterium]
MIVSEFGNWGLPNPDEIQELDKDPWWFETGYERDNGIVYPHGMRERFSDYGLAEIFGSLAHFALAVQEHMARSLHYEITSMRLQPAIAGYIITEFTDVHWECNGLLTMQRQVKHGLDTLLVPVNQDRVVTMRPAEWSERPGKNVDVDLRCFDVNGASDHGKIRWQVGAASGELAAPGGTILAPLDAVGMVRLEAQWIGADGATIATNALDLACIDVQTAQQTLCVVDDPALAGVLRDLGYAVQDLALADAVAQGAILIARHYTLALQTAAQQGARLVILAGADSAPGDIHLPTGVVLPRAHTPWQGDWATAFSWLKKQGPFAALPGTPLLEMEYAAIMPDAVIARLPLWAMSTQSWAGLALGWIHSPVSLLFAAPYGRGQVAVTTFKLDATTLPTNAVAQAVWDGLLRLV